MPALAILCGCVNHARGRAKMIDVLVVDSVPGRIEAFNKHLKGLTVAYVPSAAHAIYPLMSRAPQLLFIDYDLGTKENGNGVLLMAWVGEHAHAFTNTNVIVYSSDFWAAERMISILKRNNLTWYEHTDVWSNPRMMRALASTVEKTR